MLKGSGKDFDPILLKIFVNMLGVYPVGTSLKLDTGEFGIVLDGPKNGNPVRPHIVLMMRNDNGKFKKSKCVDLSEKKLTENHLREMLSKVSIHQTLVFNQQILSFSKKSIYNTQEKSVRYIKSTYKYYLLINHSFYNLSPF